MATHYRRLVRLAGLVCLDTSEAQDAVQNALIRAWRSHHRLREQDRLKAWLDAIVVREAIRLNERQRSRILRIVRHEDQRPSTEPPPVGVHVDLLASLRRLPATQRAAVALHYEAGYSIAEVAVLMEVPHETIRSRLRLARRRLRNEMGEESA